VPGSHPLTKGFHLRLVITRASLLEFLLNLFHFFFWHLWNIVTTRLEATFAAGHPITP
jgi:hypothetical protein